ncbi:hypothetical protein KXS07_31420 [Inquilinus limosus]|uniref:hypothetical protein n=1 Tax=Inquilinus limosus TaxID=171674 RepID=UPI003F15C00D
MTRHHLGLAMAVAIALRGLDAAAPALADTIYDVEQPAATVMRIRVERPAGAGTTDLYLRGVDFGGVPQVEAPSCDGKLLVETKRGRWRVPARCRTVAWDVALDPSGPTAVYAQRSTMMASGGILLSETTSLPRLEDADPVEALRFPTGMVLIPTAEGGLLRLPDRSQAPSFVLIGMEPVARRTADGADLVYFLDDASALDYLPNIDANLRGLIWLRQRLPLQASDRFTVAWLGASKDMFTIGGAQGSGLLLANYLAPADAAHYTSVPLATLLLYVPLHEAVHQLGQDGPRRPVWIEESLASYFGARAVLAATNCSPEARALFEHFEGAGAQFPDGLLAIERRVTSSGDRSSYGAFYAKGLAFWAALNRAMHEAGRGDLDAHLAALLEATDYGSDGALPDRLRLVLGLSPEIWQRLQQQFLRDDSGGDLDPDRSEVK